MGWKNRIVRYGEEAPDQLLANPRNWRIHPLMQQESVTTVLDHVGWVSNVIVNERTGFVVDGHLRIAQAISRNESAVPVTYVDLSEEEEALVLASLDASSHMADTDHAALTELLASLQSQNEDVSRLLADIATEMNIGAFDVPDRVPALSEGARLAQHYGVQDGALYQVTGQTEHFVLCADNTNRSLVDPLLRDFNPEAIVTDPPFDMTAEPLCATLSRFGKVGVLLMGTAHVFNLSLYGWQVRIHLVWDRVQPSSMPYRSRPVYLHNNIVMVTKGSRSLGWRRPESGFMSIVRINIREPDEAAAYTLFGQAKPARLFGEMLRGFRYRRWVDPFMGTGASLLAADALGMQLRGIEMDAEHIGIALHRFEQCGLSVEVVQSIT